MKDLIISKAYMGFVHGLMIVGIYNEVKLSDSPTPERYLTACRLVNLIPMPSHNIAGQPSLGSIVLLQKLPVTTMDIELFKGDLTGPITMENDKEFLTLYLNHIKVKGDA